MCEEGGEEVCEEGGEEVCEEEGKEGCIYKRGRREYGIESHTHEPVTTLTNTEH